MLFSSFYKVISYTEKIITDILIGKIRQYIVTLFVFHAVTPMWFSIYWGNGFSLFSYSRL